MKMNIDYIRWLASGIFGIVITIWAIEGKHNNSQLLFGLMVYAAFVYEHGYKLYFKSGKQKNFFAFYVVPFGVAACSLVAQVVRLG